MCDPITLGIIGAGLSVGGGLTSAYAQNQQLNKQSDIAAAGIIKQGQLQKQGVADVNATTKTLAESNANTQAASDKQLAAYRAALQQSSGISQSAEPNVPGASKAYKAEQTNAGAGASSYVDALAKSAATTQGTSLERIGEGQAQADTATKLGLLANNSSEQNYLTKLQIQSTQANPWLESLSMLMKGAGAGLGAYAGFAGAAAGGGGVGFSGANAAGGSVAEGGGAATAAAPGSYMLNSTVGTGPSIFGALK